MHASPRVVIPALAVVAVFHGFFTPASAQTCNVSEIGLIEAPLPVEVVTNFGRSVDIAGDFAIVGAPGQPHPGGGVRGAAHILHREKGAWSINQTLYSDTISAGDNFGHVVLMDDEFVFVSAINEDFPGNLEAGAVFVFTHNGTAWVQQQVLTPTVIQQGRRFGSSLARSGDVLIVGAINDNQQGNASAGAAYVYRLNGGLWTEEQKLLASNGQAQRRFGHAVAIQGDLALISSLPSSTGALTQAVYEFEYDGASWVEQTMIVSPHHINEHDFGYSLALQGDMVVIGAPSYDTPINQFGTAYVFVRDLGGSWTMQQQILSPGPTNVGGQFGAALDVSGDTLVVGSPFQSQSYAPSWPGTIFSAGAVCVYHLQAGQWVFNHQLRQGFIDNDFDPPPNSGFQLGSAVAISDDTIIGGSPRAEVGEVNLVGSVLLFDCVPPDCDSNGVPDVCDIDCNHNLSPDACDIAAAASTDCDRNGEPDECQNPAEYLIDNGQSFTVWGPGINGGDFIWFNQYNVVPGGQRLTHIAIPWTGYTPAGTPVTLLVYDDPNNDRDAHDAVLLATAPAVGTDAFGLNPLVTFTVYPIPHTAVGEIGDSFFIGAYVQCQPGVYVAAANNSPAGLNRSWRATNTFGNGDINNLNNNPDFGLATTNYLIRGLGLDCNGNGVWDACDIDAGVSLDLNVNNVPDECDAPCPADIEPAGGDGAVNVIDLLAVVANWGATVPPANAADINGDGVVNVNDLLAVVGAWGSCP